MKTEKLYPAFKDYIWGGTKLIEKYGKKTDIYPCAESWELSCHKDGPTRLEDGRTLYEALEKSDLGNNIGNKDEFPVLIKFIDAKNDLSVQVHPSDAYALEHEKSFGKTEMWYIVDADEGAGIYLGFKRDVTRAETEEAVKNNTLTDLMNFIPVKKGECYFIPSGTVHAICRGCLICEIQQNSNITYRVYDYGRPGKDGKPRELHIEKALDVLNFGKYVPTVFADGYLGMSRYFTVKKKVISGDCEMTATEGSFMCLTCTEGSGVVDGTDIKEGESIFIPASARNIITKGNMTMITTEVRKYYIGIDLGGTFIKGGVVDDCGNILASDKVPTECERGGDAVIENIVKLIGIVLGKTGLKKDDISGIGLGVPGVINSATGVVVYANNLGWREFPIGPKLEAATGIKVSAGNDANVAALGEAKFGAGKGCSDTAMITLGTGVGGGFVINGKLFEGNQSAGAEIGHMIILTGGEQCTCGNKGCFEAYASATALIRETKKAMTAHADSAMWKIGSLDKVDGKTAFQFKDEDKYACEVVDNYIEMLGIGLVNIANVFRPEMIMLGGGICAEGDRLIKPLQKYVDEHIYGGDGGPHVDIVKAALGNSAGIIGAAALLM